MNLLSVMRIKKWVSIFTISSMLVLGFQSASMAGVVTTEQLAESTMMELKRSELSIFMSRSDVKQQLVEMGVSGESVDQRINSLTDTEIMHMHQQIDNLPAGEGFLGGVLMVIVIFLLLDMAGVTDVFPKV